MDGTMMVADKQVRSDFFLRGFRSLRLYHGTGASSSSCGVDDTLRQVYAEHMFRLSRVHEGSGYRVQEVLKKAARGEQITIALLGGSGEFFCTLETLVSIEWH